MTSCDKIQRQSTRMVSLSTYRVHRFAPWLVLVAVVVFIQCHFTTIRESDIVKNTLEVLANNKPPDAGPVGNLHVLVVAYARTGSSFIGDLLQTFPNTFYHFEPIRLIQGPVLSSRFDEARDLLNVLFNCNISHMSDFIDWNKSHGNFMKLQRSIEYWRECSRNHSCFDGPYIDNFCRNRSIRVVKTIRLNLLEASELFASHPDLHLKIIYLARDPRGTMNSRAKTAVHEWCRNEAMCHSSASFCDGLRGDVEAACALSVKRPDDFLVVRYEDMSTDPFAATARIGRFLGVDPVPDPVLRFLKTHTYYTGSLKNLSRVSGLAYSYMTVRNSSMAAMKWRREMSFANATSLQATCKDFLSAFGYHSFKTLAAMRSNADLNGELGKSLDATCEAYNS